MYDFYIFTVKYLILYSKTKKQTKKQKLMQMVNNFIRFLRTSNKLPGYEANLNFIAINLRLTTYRLLFEEILKPPSNLLSRINPPFQYFKQMEECG